MFDRLRRISAPAENPVALSEVKQRLRIDINDADEDADIEMMIADAVARIDGPHGVGIAMVSQQWELRLDYFPYIIELPLYPVISVDSITYVDGNGTEQTVAAVDYQTDIYSNPARIKPAYAHTWPTPRADLATVKVTFTAGYGAAADVPADLKQAILLTIGHAYAHRESVTMGNPEVLPEGAQSILNRYIAGQMA